MTGSTSLVFQGTIDQEAAILKQCKSENLAIHEEKILNELRNGGILQGLPIVIERCKGKLLLKPLAFPFTTELRVGHIFQLLELLQQVHNLGYIHRDIRGANLMKLPPQSILLVDWGFAVKKGVVHRYEGTILTASPYVLTNLTNGKMDFACHPADDLCSVVCLVFCSQRPDAQNYLHELRDKISNVFKLAKTVSGFWNQVLVGIWEDFMKAAVATDYQKMKQICLELLGNW